MVTDAKDFELLGDPSKMTGYSRPPESKLTAVTRVLGVCTAVVTMMLFVIGLTFGWSSPYLAQFSSGNSPFPITKDEIYWIASLHQLGRIAGAILGAVCVHYFGKKTAMLVNGVGLLISWILVILANSASWLYVARFICGASMELSNTSFPLFLGDISRSTIRGALVALAANGTVLGILIGNVMGSYLSMKVFACVALVPNICFLLIFIWIPDSPYFLTNKGKIKDAERSILMFNSKADVNAELDSIKKYLVMSNSMTFVDLLRECNIPRNRKSGIIIIVLCMFTQCSGVNAVAAYKETILIKGKVTVIATATVSIISSSLGIVGGWLVMYLADKCGRRAIWVVSSAGVCGTTIALGIHFYLLGDGFDSTILQWIPIFSVALYEAFFNLGLACVPIIILSELFASNIRTLAAWMFATSSAMFGFASLYGYQFLIDSIDEAYVWWIHALIMLSSVIFGLVLIPELKGKTLLEIQDVLTKN